MPLTRSIRPALPLAISWLLVLPATGFQVRDKATTPKATNIESEEPKEPTLRMTPAVVCLSIDGYEQFEELPGAALTSDEKLLVYFKPLRYKVVSKGDDYVARFTQDAQIRRRGQKAVLLRKKMILDYEAMRGTDDGTLRLF